MASLLLQSFFSIFSLFLRIFLVSIGSRPKVSPYVVLGIDRRNLHNLLPERVFTTPVASSVAVVELMIILLGWGPYIPVISWK